MKLLSCPRYLIGRYPRTLSLSQAFSDWEEFDAAQFKLGQVLGMFSQTDSFLDLKGVFWSANPTSDFLYDTLQALVVLGPLEYDEEEQRFRMTLSND